MNRQIKRNVILIPGWTGQLSCAELKRRAALGEWPRTDYIELARTLDADVIDSHYMVERAGPLSRLIAHRVGMLAGQVAEVFVQQQHYHHILAWGDRLGLLLALLFKLARSRRDLIMLSNHLSRPKRAVFLQHFKVQSHLRAIINYSSVQMEVATNRLDISPDKLYLALQPVDERFWRPDNGPMENMICSVGSERDYPTLIQAIQGLELEAELAIGCKVPFVPVVGDICTTDLPANVHLHFQLNYQELRRLYSRSRFVVIPLWNVDFDAGVTSITEAMAMSKAVVVTCTRGQVDLIRDGEQGIYVRPGDPAALREAIEYLISHPEEAERMGQAGRALVEQNHTLDAYVAHLAAIMCGQSWLRPDVVDMPVVDTEVISAQPGSLSEL